MAAGFGLLKDLNAIWKSLDNSAQEKLDKVVCAAVEKFICMTITNKSKI